jgi:hypothetical protein
MRSAQLSITEDGDLCISLESESFVFDKYTLLERLHQAPQSLRMVDCLAIRARRRKGASVSEIAKQFGVHVRTVYRVTSPDWKL